ncbi:MAG: hypothetical protein KatS3mg126_1562 [Lysobacteraceae bacterium]|nr:MAG: hypothetical protein KatS3mg126_1562 [Xanthomonadaceae bacterium]
MSRRRLRVLAGLVLAWAGASAAQVIHTYTESQTGSQRIPLGYPVPRPVASLTPVDGFRDHASLDARLRLLDADSEDLSGHEVGRTRAGRPVRAYVVSDPDAVDLEGRSEAAFFVNATTHAREWGSPEVATYLVERMVAGAQDRALVRYLLDNTRLVILPVHNVDGFLQTQRYPDRVVIGKDPRVPAQWPRDGRMRRKNMSGVDEQLETFADHLLGVDLNRNHPPFWGTTTQGGTLTNPEELTYRGPAPHSEPENLALVQAAELGPPSRMRLGVDVHSFSRVFFSSNTGRSRLNAIQTRLLSVLSGHHAAVPTASGAPNGVLYRDVPDPPNAGIGVAAEYFAYQWLVPAWTLELEPQESGAEYGGTGASHSGFILPASQVRRVREAWAESFLVAFYFMAGPPWLREVRLRDAGSGALLQRRWWQHDAGSGRRQLRVEDLAPLLAGQPVRAELVFSKPMRYRDPAGQLASLPGLDTAPFPAVRLVAADGTVQALDTQGGTWLGETGFARYRDDTFVFEFVPERSGRASLEVAMTDMTGLALDADPATPVDWRDGAWSGWEDADGVEGDLGGTDRRTAALDVAAAGDPLALTLERAPSRAGEGDVLRLRLRRDPARAAGTLWIGGALDGGVQVLDAWGEGEPAERDVLLPVPDDVLAEGAREVGWQLEVAGTGRRLLEGRVEVLDNDRPGQAVYRSRDELAAALAHLAQSPAPARELVLDGGRSYAASAQGGCASLVAQAPLRLWGNRASLVAAAPDCLLLEVGGSGTAVLADLVLDGAVEGLPAAPLITSTGVALEVERSVLRHARGHLIRADGPLRLHRVALLDATITAEAAVLAASLDVASSSALAIHSGRAPSDPLQPALLQATAAVSRVLGFSFDGFPSWLLRGPFELGGSVFLSEPAPVSASPRRCDATRSLGHNVFPSAEFSCFDYLDSDLDLAVGLPARAGPDLGWRPPVTGLLDRGGSCPAVDQRGAPRPQTLAEAATPACDAGAVEAGIHPWRGFWQPQRDGHGIDLQTSGNVLTLLWYTYAEDGQPVAYLAAAPLVGAHWEADLLTTRRDPVDGTIREQLVGRVRLDFQSDTEAVLGWQFEGGPPGSETVRALDFGGAPPRLEVTGSWYPPAESGHGASIARRGEVTAVALYYYDAGGVLRWALGQGGADDAVHVPLFSYTGFCPDCDALARPVQAQPVGVLDLHFRTPRQLALEADLRYPGPAGGHWQRSEDCEPLTDPVDNRAAAVGRR